MNPTRHCIITIFLLVFVSIVSAQNTYTLHCHRDIGLASIVLATNTAGLTLAQYVRPLKLSELALLDRSHISSLDRNATFQFSSKADFASNILLTSASVAPLILMASKKARRESVVISILYLESVSLSAGMTLLTKNLVKRPRPYTYNPNVPLAFQRRTDARKSFFSGHTSSAAASCYFAAKIWSDLHPQNKWSPVVWGMAACIPAVTGYLRIRAGRHYFTDVATGYIIGATIGWLVPMMHKNSRP